jgi:hypothetical protein
MYLTENKMLSEKLYSRLTAALAMAESANG